MVFLVEERCYEDMPAFKERPGGEGKVKNVHHNMLLSLKQDQGVKLKKSRSMHLYTALSTLASKAVYNSNPQQGTHPTLV